MRFAPGTRVGPYEIHAALGEGGMGEVYRARDAKLSRDVAATIATGFRAQYEVTPDGQRFLLNVPVDEAEASSITVVTNWTAGLAK